MQPVRLGQKKNFCIHIHTYTRIINTHTHASHAHHGEKCGSQGHSSRRIQSLDRVRGEATDKQGAGRWTVAALGKGYENHLALCDSFCHLLAPIGEALGFLQSTPPAPPASHTSIPPSSPPTKKIATTLGEQVGLGPLRSFDVDFFPA